MLTSTLGSLSALLTSVTVLLLGNGFLMTLLALRAVEEQFPAAALGVIASAYYLGYLAGSYLVPPMIRSVGHIRTFAALASIASALAIGHALFVHPLTWTLLRLLMGVCVLGMYMVIESWLNGAAPHRYKGQVFSIYMAISLIALGLGQYLLLVFDVRGFEPFAYVTMILSLALVPVTLTRVQPPSVVEAPVLNLGAVIKTAPLGILGALVAGLVAGGFWGLAPVYGQRLGLDAGAVAAFMSATIFGGALLQWPLGRLSDGWDRRQMLLLVSLAAAAAAMALLSVADRGLLWLLPISALHGGLMFTVYGLSVAYVADRLRPEEMLEATTALLLTYGVGAALGPAIAGALMTPFGPSTLFLLFAAAHGALALFALYRIGVARPAPQAEQVEYLPIVRTTPVAAELDPRIEHEHPASSETDPASEAIQPPKDTRPA